MSVREIVDQLIEEAAHYDSSTLSKHVFKLEELIDRGSELDPEITTQLMQRLRGHRRFSTMLDVADLYGSVLPPKARLFEAQALIEQQQLLKAHRQLRGLLAEINDSGNHCDEALRSETLGLLGRLHKQKFVAALARDDCVAAEKQLHKSIGFYEQAYPMDKTWHGANLAALTWRAKQLGIELKAELQPEAIGQELEILHDDMERGAPLTPWQLSAAAQARMAQGKWQQGLEYYQRYLKQLTQWEGYNARFAFMGDLRQMQEIWLLDQDGEGPRAETLNILSNYLLSIPEGKVHLTVDAAQMISGLPAEPQREHEAIVDDKLTMYRAKLIQQLVKQLGGVCQIRGRNGSYLENKGGSGFLLDGRILGFNSRAPVMVTNAHVLNETRHSKDTLAPEEAEMHFQFWAGIDNHEVVAIDKCLWESSPAEYDISVWSLQNVPQDAVCVNVRRGSIPFPKPEPNPHQDLGTVIPVGHPGGRDLTFTFGTNQVVDHDLHLDSGSPRVLHYLADTEPGSSGCPIFYRTGEVVAVHRAATGKPIEGTNRNFTRGYEANEGVGVAAVARACREACR